MADGVMTKNLLMWSVANIRNNAFYKGKEEFMGNSDTMSDIPTVTDKAELEWYAWAKENNIDQANTQPETYKLMAEAFMDGYLNGFTKRFTEGE